MAVSIKYFRASGSVSPESDNDAVTGVLTILEEIVNAYLAEKLPKGALVQSTFQLHYLQKRYHAVAVLTVYPSDDAPVNPMGFRR